MQSLRGWWVDGPSDCYVALYVCLWLLCGSFSSFSIITALTRSWCSILLADYDGQNFITLSVCFIHRIGCVQCASIAFDPISVCL
jgi:hypothetical protein